MTPAPQEQEQWHERPTVELADDASIRLVEVDHRPGPFSIGVVDEMFALGLQVPAEATPPSRAAGPVPQIVLAGEARFLIGRVDVGRDLGLAAVNRGLTYALAAARARLIERQLNAQHARATTQRGARAVDPSDDPDEPGTDASNAFREEDARLRVMTIDQAADRWDELLPRVQLWDRVVLTQDGRRVALIVAWDWWALHQHRQTSLEAVYWAHWYTGEFNVGGYAWDLMRLLEPRDARVSFAADEAEPRDDDDDDDDDAR